ncbi:ECF-type sigma factor [Arenimonas sp. MALMAid1274]|uniref:ECF-type sigma factor n=1 Tax=Arenimonas sp. MALMAid1274 TaxID=3411630 RepID=UPI003B9DF388
MDSATLDHPPEVLATAATLAPLLMDDMRRHARRERRRVRAGETLRTTALVNEAYLRLQRSDGWHGELHFLRAAALAMRQALVDHARQKLAAKRGGGAVDSLEDHPVEPFWVSDERMVELDEALQQLSALNPRLTQVIECRFFGGYSDLETARILGVTDRTVRRDWIKARAWLFQALGDSPEPDSDPAAPMPAP